MKKILFGFLILTSKVGAQETSSFQGYYLEIGFISEEHNGFVSSVQFLFNSKEEMSQAIKDPDAYVKNIEDTTQIRLFNHTAFIYRSAKIIAKPSIDTLLWINSNRKVSLYRGNDITAHSIFKLKKNDNIYFYAKQVSLEVEKRSEEVIIGAKSGVLACYNREWYLLRSIHSQYLLDLNKEPFITNYVTKVSLPEALEKYHPCINTFKHEYDAKGMLLWQRNYLFPDL